MATIYKGSSVAITLTLLKEGTSTPINLDTITGIQVKIKHAVSEKIIKEGNMVDGTVGKDETDASGKVYIYLPNTLADDMEAGDYDCLIGVTRTNENFENGVQVAITKVNKIFTVNESLL